MSFFAYYRKFVYDRDFAHAPQVTYNEIIAKGDTTGDASAAYPDDSIVVEYYFPADDKKLWAALRLIFQRTGTEWLLAGVTHDQWTI